MKENQLISCYQLNTRIFFDPLHNSLQNWYFGKYQNATYLNNYPSRNIINYIFRPSKFPSLLVIHTKYNKLFHSTYKVTLKSRYQRKCIPIMFLSFLYTFISLDNLDSLLRHTVHENHFLFLYKQMHNIRTIRIKFSLYFLSRDNFVNWWSSLCVYRK